MSTHRSSLSQQVVRGACPTFFRALCCEARTGGDGYALPGRVLASHILDLAPYDVENDEWFARVDKLEALVSNDAPLDAIVSWLSDNLPRCLALVPARRRLSFAGGFQEGIEERLS